MGIDPLLVSDPFIMGVSLEIAFFIGLFIIQCPFELAVLVLIPFNLILVGFYIPAIQPLLAIVCGIYIGFMFLRIVRR